MSWEFIFPSSGESLCREITKVAGTQRQPPSGHPALGISDQPRPGSAPMQDGSRGPIKQREFLQAAYLP